MISKNLGLVTEDILKDDLNKSSDKILNQSFEDIIHNTINDIPKKEFPIFKQKYVSNLRRSGIDPRKKFKELNFKDKIKTLSSTKATIDQHKLETGRESEIKHGIPSSLDLKIKNKNYGKATLGIVALTALIAASWYIYRRFLSAATRSCKGLVGKEKEECIKQFKIRGIQTAIKKLNNDKLKCKLSKNPKACITIIDNKINKWKIKLATL